MLGALHALTHLFTTITLYERLCIEEKYQGSQR